MPAAAAVGGRETWDRRRGQEVRRIPCWRNDGKIKESFRKVKKIATDEHG
jgi:hypothetical protein